MGGDGEGIGGIFRTADGQRFEVVVPDEAAFEALRDALDDPVWLVGATWEILTTNEFKRGRFEDALSAWLERQDSTEAVTTLGSAGVGMTPFED